MISYLRGTIKSKTVLPKKNSFAVLDVGGVGYKIFVLDELLNESQVGQELEVFVYTQVAETALDLFGFQLQEELDFFELLLTVSGVGPRSAIDILQKSKIEDLRTGIQSGNADILNKVSGIGPKTAEKIVVGLKDKIGEVSSGSGQDWGGEFGEALEALVGLGYSASHARDALGQIKAKDAGEKVKEALQLLGKN